MGASNIPKWTRSKSLPKSDEMLELDSQDAAGRIADLERKVLEQGDELVCLKASLAEVLRRINILEGMRLNQQTSSLSPGTPLRLNGSAKELPMRPRPSSYSVSKVDVSRRYAGIQNSSLPQRRAVHYQSTGSLHSDSHSSSSVSPIPSPSPRATPQPLNGNSTSRRPISVIGTSNSSSIVSSPSTNSSPLHKRWSSIGDFNQIPSGAVSPAPSSINSKYSNKSFLNLFKTNSNSLNSNYKHGTNSATYNYDDKVLKIFFRGKSALLYAPSILADNYDITKVSTAPSKKLRLDWVYGYRGRDCRSNLYSLPTGEMVYFVAAVVVLYNVEDQHQRHYVEHTSDVKSLAIHPNKMLIATSQSAGNDKANSRAHIRVWNSISLHTQALIGINDFNISVCCMSFSKLDGGTLLVAVDENIDHTISVWDWQRGDGGYRIAETKCSVDTIVSAEFHPLDRNTIVTCGKSHIAFWSLDATGVLFKRMGVFETRDKPKYVTCVAFLQTGETITGDSNGNLQVWGRGTNTICKFVKNVHEGGVFSICVQRDGTVLTGGGKDGRIVEFGSNLARTGLFGEIEGHFGGIRVLSEGKGSQLLVGTTRNCILWGSLELGFQPIILGHTDDLWGLAVHPIIPQFATAGYDRVLQLWESMSHSILWSKDIGEAAQCVAFSHNGTNLIVGTVTGKWMVFDTQSRELLATFADGNEALQVIEFSPDGSLIALGSRDNNIYIYQVSDDGTKYARVGKCVGHSSFITHMDWSVDNQTLRSNSADFELLFWNTGTCRQIPQATLTKDVKWATNNCPITFTTVGIWPEAAEGADINCCDRSHDSKLIVTADETGKVKLYNYPVIQPKSLCQSYGGHSSSTTAIKFLYDDTRAVSIGGKDTAVLQWIVS